jgi:hypothetical protein
VEGREGGMVEGRKVRRKEWRNENKEEGRK